MSLDALESYKSDCSALQHRASDCRKLVGQTIFLQTTISFFFQGVHLYYFFGLLNVDLKTENKRYNTKDKQEHKHFPFGFNKGFLSLGQITGKSFFPGEQIDPISLKNLSSTLTKKDNWMEFLRDKFIYLKLSQSLFHENSVNSL